jgi:hypothetical protein
MPSAISMIQNAVTGFGSAAPAGSGQIWSFPNTEARDLAGRLFGNPGPLPYSYDLMLSMYVSPFDSISPLILSK